MNWWTIGSLGVTSWRQLAQLGGDVVGDLVARLPVGDRLGGSVESSGDFRQGVNTAGGHEGF